MSQSINLPIDQSVNQLPGNELRGYSVGEQLNAMLIAPWITVDDSPGCQRRLDTEPCFLTLCLTLNQKQA